MDRGDKRTENRVENAPGIPNHDVDRISLSELPNTGDRNQRQHQRPENVEDGTKQCVKKAKDDNGQGINNVRDQKHSNSDRSSRIAGNHVPECQVRIGLGLLLKLSHPVNEHVAGAGAITDETRDRIERPIHVTEHCRPIRHDHGDQQILDCGHSQRLKIAAS